MSARILPETAVVLCETPRLRLRRWQADDVAPMAEINADLEVMRWIGAGPTHDEARTLAAIHAWESLWDAQGFGLFAVEERSSSWLLGFTGLAVPNFLPEVMPAVEVGWRLGRPAWGRGFATEAARATVDFAFTRAGLDRVISIAQRGNDASLRIMDKLGMHHERDTIDPTCGRQVSVHQLTAEQWRAAHGS